jgi:hypothetical protein
MSPAQALHLLGQLARAETFRVFVVRTADGREYEVEMAGRIALPSNPQAGTCAIYCGEELHIVALDAITSIEVAR